jgi:ubiquinone/menaquinone biosynthesis C-methylase UbiE
MERRVDYDAIADRYDRRYRENDYSGIERALLAFLGAPCTRALEAGCGTGHWLAVADACGHAACGVDASHGMLAQARASAPRAALVQARAERLPLRDASVDRVFCVNAFHHFDDQRDFVAEARRVLRPGGGLLVLGLDPHTGLDRWWVYDLFAPVLEIDRRRYPPTAWIRAALAEAGFASRETSVAQRLPWRGPARAVLTGGRVDRSWTSQLSVLSDAELAAGEAELRARMEACARRGEELELHADLRIHATTGWVAPAPPAGGGSRVGPAPGPGVRGSPGPRRGPSA